MMLSVRWPSEMAHWTIHKAAGLPAPVFDQISFDTSMEQIQKDYVMAKLAGQELNVGSNSKAIDFLLSVGREIHNYIDSLKTLQTRQIASVRLQDTVRNLLQSEAALLEENASFSKDLKLPSQIETAHKVIALFQREMQEMLPTIFVERQESFQVIEGCRREIRNLEVDYFQKASASCAKLKEKIEFAKQCLVGREEGKQILSKIIGEVTRFLSVFSSETSLRSVLELPQFLDGVERNISYIQRVSKNIDNVSISLQLDQAKELLTDLKKIAIFRNSYQEKIGQMEEIKKENKIYLASTQLKRVERDLFEEMLNIQVELDDADEDLCFGELELEDHNFSPRGFPHDISPAFIKDVDTPVNIVARKPSLSESDMIAGWDAMRRSVTDKEESFLRQCIREGRELIWEQGK